MAKTKSFMTISGEVSTEMHDILRATGLSEFMQIDFASAEGSLTFEKVKEGVLEDDGGILFQELNFYIPNEELATILCLKNQDFEFNASDEEVVVSEEILSEVLKQSVTATSTIKFADMKDAFKKWIKKMMQRVFMKTDPSTLPRRQLNILLRIREKPEETLGSWKYCVRHARVSKYILKRENAHIVYAYILENSKGEIEIAETSRSRIIGILDLVALVGWRRENSYATVGDQLFMPTTARVRGRGVSLLSCAVIAVGN